MHRTKQGPKNIFSSFLGLHDILSILERICLTGCLKTTMFQGVNVLRNVIRSSRKKGFIRQENPYLQSVCIFSLCVRNIINNQTQTTISDSVMTWCVHLKVRLQ